MTDPVTLQSRATKAPLWRPVRTDSRRHLYNWSIPCGERPRPQSASGKPGRGPKASLDNAAIGALARATHSNSRPVFDSSIMLLLSIRSRPCTSSNQSGPLRLRRKRDFLPLCRVVRRPLILSPSCS